MKTLARIAAALLVAGALAGCDSESESEPNPSYPEGLYGPGTYDVGGGEGEIPSARYATRGSKVTACTVWLDDGDQSAEWRVEPGSNGTFDAEGVTRVKLSGPCYWRTVS